MPSPKRLPLATVTALTAVAALLVSSAAPAQESPQNDEDKTLYFLGVYLAKNVVPRYFLEPNEADMVAKGFLDSVKGQAMELDEQTYGPMLNALASSRAEKAVAAEKVSGTAYIAEMAGEDGAVTTESGLVYLEVAAGDGASPTLEDKVSAHYHGTFRDGGVFDSSIDRGRPADFKMTGVIKCWTEALQKMKVGGKAKITCPSDLAYGDRGMPPAIPGGAVLTFDVELLAVKQ